MGHRINSTMAQTDYQAPDRDIDLTAARHQNMTSDTSIIEFHSSVAWDARPSVGLLPQTIRDRITGDAELKKLMREFAKADLDVKTETNMYTEEALKVCKAIYAPPPLPLLFFI